MASAKVFKIPNDRLKQLIEPMGGCIASDRITVDGFPVASMSRNAPTNPQDTGWTFLAGNESEAYLADLKNFTLWEVNCIANYDPDIIPFLFAMPGSIFDRHRKTGRFIEARDSKPNAALARLPTGITVVNGRVEIEKGWSFDLGEAPFRRRLDEGSHVLWRPSFTVWCAVFDTPKGSGTIADQVAKQAEQLPPEAMNVVASPKSVTYRLPEKTAPRPSLNLRAFNKVSQLKLSVYFDREEDEEAAARLVKSVR